MLKSIVTTKKAAMNTIELPIRPGTLPNLEFDLSSLPDIFELNLLGIAEYPQQLWLIALSNNRHAIWSWNQIHGLACFADCRTAVEFIETKLSERPASPQCVDFDEARDIAKIKSQLTPVTCLMIVYNLDTAPQIHYIK